MRTKAERDAAYAAFEAVADAIRAELAQAAVDCLKRVCPSCGAGVDVACHNLRAPHRPTKHPHQPRLRLQLGELPRRPGGPAAIVCF